MELSTRARTPKALHFVRARAGVRHRRSPAPKALARQMVQLRLEEMEALEGARISHGAIREKFTNLARAKRERRHQLWRAAGPPESRAVVEVLCAMVAHSLGELAEMDPGDRTPMERLAALTALSGPEPELDPEGVGFPRD